MEERTKIEEAEWDLSWHQRLHGEESWQAKHAQEKLTLAIVTQPSIVTYVKPLPSQSYSSPYADEGLNDRGAFFFLFTFAGGPLGVLIWMYYFPSFVGFVLSIIGTVIGVFVCGVIATLIIIVYEIFKYIKTTISKF